MLPLYGFTLFFSALLLFMVQPMIARLILPQLGGTPAVWNTCMVFFQAMLLAGYGYTFFSTRRVISRYHGWIHLAVMILPLAFLPIALPGVSPWSATEQPIAWLMWGLLLSVGLPFFVLATSNPMLQHWFALSGHQQGRDPYFLYAASNAGSLVGLFGYPFLVEPLLGLQQQTLLWSIGYAVLVLLVISCAWTAWRHSKLATAGHATATETSATAPTTPDQSAIGSAPLSQSKVPTWRQRAHWIALALIPSSLMLGVTSHLTTDVASFPLLWVIPLGLYLITFILAFSSRFRLKQKYVVRMVPMAVLPVVVTYPFSGALTNQTMLFGLNLLAFFVVALACHGELADRRPQPRFLTEFYFCLSLGGVLGGMFNALLAPSLFVSPIEYSLALVCACLVMPVQGKIRRNRESRLLDLTLPIVLGCVCLILALGVRRETNQMAMIIALAVPAVTAFTFARRPVRFGLAMAAILAGGISAAHLHEDILFWERGFFGSNRVVADAASNRHVLIHGTTFHGWQAQDSQRRQQPCAYYHRKGPLGAVFSSVSENQAKVGVIGLGCGTVMAYHRPGWHFRFFEIDPTVKQIAEDPRLFTYLSSHSAKDYDVVLGDARLMLDRDESSEFDVMLMDAFSSDMVPAHLLTREAMQVYDRHLKPDGLIAFHVSNRFMDLVPVVHGIAADAGYHTLVMSDGGNGLKANDSDSIDHVPSIYVVVSRSERRLESLMEFPGAQKLPNDTPPSPWTDDYCHILGVLRW